MSDVKRCPCRGSNEMCGCQNGPHPVRQDPEAEITALRARLAEVEAQLATARRDAELLNRIVLPMVEQRSRDQGDAWDQAAAAIRALANEAKS